MAEAAGLAVGVLAVAGIFSDCIELFNYISAARLLPRDYELLSTKLEIEKVLLVHWAERLRLLRSDYDWRLDEPHMREVVSRTLANIQFLLSDGKALREKYGLQENHVDPDDIKNDTPLWGRQRLELITSQLEVMKLSPKAKGKGISTMRRIVWSVHDKEKFEVLIDNLSILVAKLNQLVPDTAALPLDMVEVDLDATQSCRSLKLLRDASSRIEQRVSDIANKKLTEMCENRVLRSIWFRVMDERLESVEVPHPETLHWVFRPPSGVPWDGLSAWLSSGTGIYWVSGKAGSGKSTLMKFALFHDETAKSLDHWAEGAGCTVASFFFWWVGTAIQKSQEGLSRALLYQILAADHSLIPALLPKMWQEAEDTHDGKLQVPSLTEMKLAFLAMSKVRDCHRYCFFIDGLDEYCGDYKEGISTLINLAANPNIKIVVSSRPITACVDAFSDQPGLCLHDLTKRDIEVYVDKTVGSHPRMNQHLRSRPHQARAILHDLVAKASGVFLWVVLACRSLIDGFAAWDRISDLRDRVDSLPLELQDMFEQLLLKIEPRYRLQAAKLLRVCFEHARLVGGPLYGLGLAIVEEADMELAETRPFNRYGTDERLSLREQFEGRLRSRCWGLIEVSRSPESMYFENLHFSDNWVVGFMHQSVYEFLTTLRVWQRPVLEIDVSSFDTAAVLYCANLCTMSTMLDGSAGKASGIKHHFMTAFAHATRITRPNIVLQAISKLEEFFENAPDTYMSTEAENDVGLFLACANNLAPESETRSAFLLSVEAGLVNFLEVYEKTRAVTVREMAMQYPLLHHAIMRPTLSFLRCSLLDNADMLCYLLENGCDPARQFAQHHVGWTFWVRQATARDIKEARDAAKVMKAFLHAGADMDRAEEALGETLEERVSWLYGVGVDDEQRRWLYSDVLEVVIEVSFEERAGVLEVGEELLGFLRAYHVKTWKGRVPMR